MGTSVYDNKEMKKLDIKSGLFHFIVSIATDILFI